MERLKMLAWIVPADVWLNFGGTSVNRNILEGKWRQLKGSMTQYWAKLTDNDLEYIQGSYEKLIGRLQERYGYTRDQAEKEYDLYSTQFTTRTVRTFNGLKEFVDAYSK